MTGTKTFLTSINYIQIAWSMKPYEFERYLLQISQWAMSFKIFKRKNKNFWKKNEQMTVGETIHYFLKVSRHCIFTTLYLCGAEQTVKTLYQVHGVCMSMGKMKYFC